VSAQTALVGHTFEPGVLATVRALGGQFKHSRLTQVSCGEVIYLPALVEPSLGYTYDEVEGRDHCVRDILDRLPVVPGLRWVVGNPLTVREVLESHLKKAGKHLLRGQYTWTDGHQPPPDGLDQVVVGYFDGDVVLTNSCHPGDWGDTIGLFVLGVPA